MSLKQVLLKKWIWLLMVSLLAVACAPAPPAASTDSMDGDAMGDEKVFRATIPVFVQDWSPLRGGGWESNFYAFWMAGPMYLDENGEPVPYVFNEWSPNDDQTVWTFKIDPAAVYSDGSAITAEDVVASWNLITNPATTHQRVTLFLSGIVGFEAVFNGEAMTMPGIEALDERTVQVTLEAPDPIFHKKISTAMIGPVKASQVVGEDGLEVAQWWHPDNNPATTGPFMPESINLDTGEAVFVRNPNFWVAEPKMDKFILRTVEDRTIVTTMLANDELDQGFASGPNVVEMLGEDYVACEPSSGTSRFWMNPNIAPTDDINFRKALIMSVNIQELWEVANESGQGEPPSQILRALPGEDPNFEPHPYDPEAAKEAMAASAYANAADVPKMIIAGVSSPGTEIAAQYIIEQWRQVLGIDAFELSPQFDSYEGPIPPALFRDGVGTRVPDAPLMLLGAIHSSSNLARNIMGGFQDAEIDALIDEALTKAADDPDRVSLAQQAQQRYHDLWLDIAFGQGCSNKGGVMHWVKNARRTSDAQWYEPWNIDIEEH